MPALRQPAYKTIRAPILADRSKVRKAAGQICGKILRSRFVTPDDVPLRIRIIGIFHGPPILLANIGARGARLPGAHGKRAGCRLDEGTLQHKNRNEKGECREENQEKRQDSSLPEAFHTFAPYALMPPQYSGSLWHG